LGNTAFTAFTGIDPTDLGKLSVTCSFPVRALGGAATSLRCMGDEGGKGGVLDPSVAPRARVTVDAFAGLGAAGGGGGSY